MYIHYKHPLTQPLNIELKIDMQYYVIRYMIYILKTVFFLNESKIIHVLQG